MRRMHRSRAAGHRVVRAAHPAYGSNFSGTSTSFPSCLICSTLRSGFPSIVSCLNRTGATPLNANAELCQIVAGSNPGRWILGWPAASRCIQPYSFGVPG